MNDETITADERYTSATHAKNLKVEAERQGSADVLVAAAWCKSRLGSSLLRLRSEWDGSQHPRRIKIEAIKALALTLQGPDREKKARHIANDWYRHEIMLTLQRLKTLPEVRARLVTFAERLYIPEDVVADTLIWWLDHTCQACSGLKFEKAENSPTLLAKQCKVCHGTGEIPVPWRGIRIENHINECLQAARSSIRTRLHLRK